MWCLVALPQVYQMAARSRSILNHVATDQNVTDAPSDVLLGARGLAAGYHKHPVVEGIDLEVRAGEVVALLGPNGAGKTTTLLALTGELPPLAGEVTFRGVKTTSPLHRRARNGLAFVPEERSVFPQLTAGENLKIGRGDDEIALALFPELKPLLNRRGGLLSGGEQQMLTLARALSRKPVLLLADELSLGLAPLVVQRLLKAVRTAADERGVGVASRRAARQAGAPRSRPRPRHARRSHRADGNSRRGGRTARRGISLRRRRPGGRDGAYDLSEALAERLRRLEDEQSIRETLYSYGHALDYGYEDEFVECWTPTAVLVWQPTPERDVGFVERRLVGRDAITEAFRGHTHAPEMFHKHLLFQPQIRLTGDTATVESGFARLDEGAGGPVLRSFGRYRDELVRCDDGRWRFTLREAFIESRVSS